MSENRLITNKDLVDMGYRPSTANHIIHLARDLLVARGFSFYGRKRMMVVPKKIVEEVIGSEL